MEPSFIQVGVNIRERAVKLRAPDAGSTGGFVVVCFDADGARKLADEIDGLTGAVAAIKLVDGTRWVELDAPIETRRSVARNLRRCAAEVSCD